MLQNYRTGEVKVDDAPALRSGAVLVANRFSLMSASTERMKVEADSYQGRAVPKLAYTAR